MGKKSYKEIFAMMNPGAMYKTTQFEKMFGWTHAAVSQCFYYMYRKGLIVRRATYAKTFNKNGEHPVKYWEYSIPQEEDEE